MKKTVILWLCMAIITIMTGCQMIKIEEGNRTPLEYTIVENNEIPEEAARLIEEKKAAEFQMTYQEEDMLYLLQGYGIQSSGGYSIRVEKVSENDTELHVKTKLIGPEGKDGETEGISCPYLVIKVENRHKKVVFD